jgi:prophage regulatory protein
MAQRRQQSESHEVRQGLTANRRSVSKDFLRETFADSYPLTEKPPDLDAHHALPAITHVTPHPVRRAIRRAHLRQIVPLADTTIYEMEQRGEFPRRFYLTPRCVVWDLAEVEAWIEERRLASDAALNKRAPTPDVRQRKTRPVRR